MEGSLKRLRTDYVDVLLLHRPDPLIEPEDVAHAFDELKVGKVRWFGVSDNFTAQMGANYLNQPLIADPGQLDPIHTRMLDAGILFNQYNERLARNEGTIEYCRQHNITLQAWAPSPQASLLANRVQIVVHILKKQQT